MSFTTVPITHQSSVNYDGDGGVVGRADLPEHILLVTTSWWPMVAHFAHELVKAGCRVSVLCPRGHAVEAVTGVKVYLHRAAQPLRRLSGVIRRGLPAFIIPADDRSVSYLHALHARGTAAERALIERSIGPEASYGVALSRVRLHALAERLGIAVPPGQAVPSIDALRSVLADGEGPWVLKTDGAWSGHGVRIADSPAAAIRAARALQRRQAILPALRRLVLYRDPFWLAASVRRSRPELSVQGYVQGWPATLAMVCEDGVVLAATVADVVVTLHETGPSVVIRLVDRPDTLAAAHALAAELRLNGFYGLDFMVEPETGRALLIEMNPRLTPLANVRVGIAGDLVGALVQSLSGRVIARPVAPVAAEKVSHFPLPRAFDPADPRLTGVFSNVPDDNPALVAAMQQKPWPDRRMLARMVAAFRRQPSKA